MAPRSLLILAAAVALAVPSGARAAAVDVSVGPSDVSLSPALSSYPAGTAVRVYVRIHNAGQEDALASAAVSVGGVEVGQASPVPVRAGGSAETWLDWIVPSQPFSLAVAVSAEGDAQQRNNRVETGQYAVSAPSERDIFSPPAGREGISSSSSAALAATGTEPVATTTLPEPAPAPAAYTPPAAVEGGQAAAPLDDYAWIPYVLIALGAVGFAWGMRGRRRSAPRAAVPAAAPARAPRRRAAKVYRPELVVVKPEPKPRRAPRRKPVAPPAEPTA